MVWTKESHKKGVETRKRNGSYVAWNKGKSMKHSGSFKKGHQCIGGFKTRFKKGKRVSKKTEFKKGQIPWNKGLIGYNSGSKNNNWKGGITKENTRLRNSVRYLLWRDAVFKRDNYTCQDCGKIGGDLHCHHIKSFADYPELRFMTQNGKTLCIKCHSMYHLNLGLFKNKIQGGCTCASN